MQKLLSLLTLSSCCKDTSYIGSGAPTGSHYTFTTSLNPDNILKSRDNHFADQRPSSQSCGFSSSHVRMWELDHKEGRALKNWCFWTGVLEKTLESPLDSKESKPVHPKGNQPWIFIGRTDAEAEAPILWPPDVKSWLTGKDPDAGKDWGHEKQQRMRWHGWMAWST